MSCFEIFGHGGKRIASGHVGEIKLFPVDTPPAHTLVCNGAELSIAVYPELYAVIGTKYGGNGTTTFRLPKAEDVIYAAGANHAVGEAIQEGLPNISGNFYTGDYGKGVGIIYSPEGAFRQGQYNGYTLPNNIAVSRPEDDNRFNEVVFKASASTPIYGTSEHVTPAGIALLACIVYE